MKIKRIFENNAPSVEDQKQDIEEIFTEFIDDRKYSTLINRNIEVEDFGKYFVVEIYDGVDIDNANTIKTLRELVKKNLSALDLLKRLEPSFKRLEYLDYRWHVWMTDDGFKIEIGKKY